MPPRPYQPQTSIARLRIEAGIPQKQFADLCNMSWRTLQRLETLEDVSPRIGWLVNAATVLGVDWTDLIEPQWLEWYKRKELDRDQPQSNTGSST
jgi:transcriptional regulator with XRE-family HTH domain